MSWSLLVRGTGGDTRLQRACDDSSREERSAVQGAVLRKGGRAASRDGVGQAGRQSWADKDQEIGPCERWDRRVPGLRLGSNWCSILGGLAVLASLNRKDKDRRAVKPGRSREFGMIIFEQAWGTGESHGRREHHTRSSPASKDLYRYTLIPRGPGSVEPGIPRAIATCWPSCAQVIRQTATERKRRQEKGRFDTVWACLSTSGGVLPRRLPT